MKQELMDAIQETPVIAAVKDDDGLQNALQNENIRVVFILYGDICNISTLVQRIHAAGKFAIVHVDLIAGLASKEVAVDFIRSQTEADGIISTRQSFIRRAKELGLAAILRVFLLDSISLESLGKMPANLPDCLDILPGTMPKILRRVCADAKVPVLTGGLIADKEDVMAALDAGAMDAAEAQCIDLSDENGFFSWLLNFLFGWLGKSDTEPVYSGWRTSGGKTYYYSQTTNKPVTGIQCIDNKLYYFNADGVLENGKTFGVDVSKYQKNINWNQIKKAGVSFVIVRIGYRGYGASGTLVLDPMFEEHFTNVKNAGLKVGVYFFSQATTEEEAKEEAFACAYVLNGRKLDYPIFFDTEASGASGGSGRADGLGVADRTKCAVAFCEEVKANGYKPGVYASTLWYRNRVDLSSLTKYTIWNAHYGVASSPIDCALWQGTCTARLPGYKGDLDVNISYIG